MSTVTTSQSRSAGSTDRPPQTDRGGEITSEAVRSRAYQIYQTRSCNGASGDRLSDWLQAEHEVEVLSQGELLMTGDQE